MSPLFRLSFCQSACCNTLRPYKSPNVVSWAPISKNLFLKSKLCLFTNKNKMSVKMSPLKAKISVKIQLDIRPPPLLLYLLIEGRGVSGEKLELEESSKVNTKVGSSKLRGR